MVLATHPDTEQQEIIERYVRDQLSPEDRRAFQEHFFTCDACFSALETTDRFISGIRNAAANGLLSSTVGETRVSGWHQWFQPAFAVAFGALLIAGAVAGWFLLYREPKLREQLAREQQLREQAGREDQQRTAQMEEQLRQEREARTKAEAQLLNQQRDLSENDQQAENRPPSRMVTPESFGDRSESNVPMVMLDATRDAGAASNSLDISSGARTFMLWIETSSQTRIDSYQLQIYTGQSKLIETVRGLKKNSYGALTVSLPSKSFQSGSYVVRLYGDGSEPASLVAEYRLQIRKH